MKKRSSSKILAALMVSTLCISKLGSFAVRAADDPYVEESVETGSAENEKKTSNVNWAQPRADWYEDYIYDLDEEKGLINIRQIKNDITPDIYVTVPATASISGKDYRVALNRWGFNSNGIWVQDKYNNTADFVIKGVRIEDGVKIVNAEDLFSNCNLEVIEIGKVDMSQVTSCYGMFAANQMTEIDLSNLDTSGVIDMGAMFFLCPELKKLDLSGFDTSSCWNMSQMFSLCPKLTEIDLSTFNTSNVGRMNKMFDGCKSLKHLDLKSFDTSNVELMAGMFAGCTSLDVLDLRNFRFDNLELAGPYTTDGKSFWCVSLGAYGIFGSDYGTSDDPNMGDVFEGRYRSEIGGQSEGMVSEVILPADVFYWGVLDGDYSWIPPEYDDEKPVFEEYFSGTGLKTIYYCGSQKQWKDHYNQVSKNTEIIYNYGNQGNDDTEGAEINGVPVTSLKEAFKQIDNPAMDYVIELKGDMLGEKNLTIPSKARSVTINGNGHVIEIIGTKLSAKSDLVLENVTICTKTKKGAAAKLTLSASKGLTINETVKLEVSKATVKSGKEIILNSSFSADSVNCKELVLNEAANLKVESGDTVSVKNTLIGKGGSIELGEGLIKPISLGGTVNGTVIFTGAVQANGTQILKCSAKKLSADTLKTAFDVTGITSNTVDTHLYYYSNGKAGIYGEVIDVNGEKYGLWKDAVAAMNRTKKGEERELTVTLFGDVNLNGAFTLPRKGYIKLTINGNGHKMIFTSNIKLTGNTAFNDVTLTRVNKKGVQIPGKVQNTGYEYVGPEYF